MARTTLVPDCSISASFSINKVTVTKATNNSRTMIMASKAPWPGAWFALRVSSLRLSVSSHPQKKNNAVKAPLRRELGQRKPLHRERMRRTATELDQRRADHQHQDGDFDAR